MKKSRLFQQGTMGMTLDFRLAFAYSEEWLQSGFSVSPFSLPLKKEVFVPKSYDPFEGLFGVFADSLPDGWGRLLVDRMLIKIGIPLRDVNSLMRLTMVGDLGMGAMQYRPQKELETQGKGYDIDAIAMECKKIFDSDEEADLDTAFALGGSSGEARPKIMKQVDGEDWIIKFATSTEPKNAGEMEYRYSLCAKNCGIEMAETKLLPSKYHSGYFATKRFDRDGNERKHIVSVSGLLETSHRIPNLDYHILMQLTLNLTKEYEELEKMFRLMCFNVFSHNRDDHSKNFSFLYEEP